MSTRSHPKSSVQSYETRRDAEILRTAALIAAAVSLIYAFAGVLGGDSTLILRAAAPALVAGYSFWQIRRSSPRAGSLLLFSAVVVTIQVKIIDQPDIEMAALIGLLMIGAAASVVIRRHRLPFLAGYSILLVVSQAWWFRETLSFANVLFRSVVPAVAFLFISWLLIWTRQSQEAEESRYELLFARAPVSIWEEDYGAVGDWLAELRRRGVTDLRKYLTDHPEDVEAAATKIIVKDVNESTLDLLEVEDKSQLLGPLPADSVTDHARQSFIEQFVAIWEDRDHLDTALRGTTIQGNDIDGVLRWVVPRDKGQLDLGNVVIAMVDISDLRRAERRLQELVKSKDQFIASVSHELRTPLTAVVGLTDELRNHHTSFSSSEKQEFMDLIADQAADVANIVEDLLVAARADIGTVAVAPKQIDIAGAVRSAAEMFENGSHPEIELSPNGELRAMADEVRVRQILRNLLSNAQRYGGEKVTVRAGRDGNQIWIEVSDDGPGVGEEERERIFEPYATAHRVAGITAAVGLGLTVSRQLARLMSGDITYRYENGESTFRLSLPAPT
jgi:signal transduction histidine kinase